MKYLREFILVVFAIIMLILSLGTVLVALEYIDLSMILIKLPRILIANQVTTIIIAGIISLLSLIAIFSNASHEEDMKSGIGIKHETGNVYITKDTFESIVYNVTRSYASIKNVKVMINICEDGIVANVIGYILPDTVVTTLTSKLQEDIKNAVLKQTTVEIKEANIKIKGVYANNDKKPINE